MTNYEAAKKEDEAGLSLLHRECLDCIRVNGYMRISKFARDFIAGGYDYSVRTINRVFAENPETRFVSEKVLLDILEFFNIEVKKNVTYELGADTLEKVPEED